MPDPAPTVVVQKHGHTLLWVVLGVGITVVGMRWWMKHQMEAMAQAYTETATAQFQKINDHMAQMEGHVVTTGQLEEKVKDVMGPELNKFVAAQNGTMVSLASAIGQLSGSLNNLAPIAAGNGAKTDAGGFQNVTLQQSRGGAPPLTSVKLNYDPQAPGIGLTGAWANNTERFTASFGEWRTEHDGLRSAVTMKREVLDLSGHSLGVEQIPITGGDAYFSSDQIARTAPSPTHTLMLGSSYDVHTGKQRPGVIMGEQLTPTWGVATGYVNNSWLVMSSFRWGHK